MSNKFIDDKMEYIENDIDKIKMKTGMYISYVGEKGALHLCKEVIQNAIDECANPKSPAKNINIILDIAENSLSVEDDGRGIPEDDFPMEILCTRLNSGSKFTREQGGASSGENGVGLTAVNALSDIFEWTSCRDSKKHVLTFENGVKSKDDMTKSKKEHGCIVKFIPSKKYLGKTANIPKKALIKWVDNISYFIPKNCKITLEIYKALEFVEKIKFKARPMSELLEKELADQRLSNIYSFDNDMSFNEDFRGERKIKRNLKLQFVFSYTDSIEPWIDSYCNYVNTTSGGVHLNTVQDELWRYLSNATNSILTEKEKSKYKVLKVDVMTGLNLVVNIFTDAQMQFVGQTKNEVSSDQLLNPIKELASKALDEYFSTNKNDLNQLTKIIKANCKARIDLNKLKAATVKETVNKFDKHKMDNFTPCNNEGSAYKELHICEGKSAAGSLVDGRDPDTQAFLSFRGVTANGFKRNAATILDNKEWYEYVKLLKTNFGPKFDLSKLYYDKIIIETDSDIDGYGITSGIGAFHALYMPELVKAGKLYKALAPLYHIDDKNHEFVRDKREYVEVYQDKIIKNYAIKICLLGNDDLTTSEFREFIYDTQEYSEELVRLSKHFGVNKFLIEDVAFQLSKIDPDSLEKAFEDQKSRTTFIEHVQSIFPEIVLKGKHSLRGVVDGRFQSININKRFLKKVEDLNTIYDKYGLLIKVKEKKVDKEYKTITIGEFLDLTSKFRPKIITRYKGLGEANSKQLWETTLNPNNRILIQLTMDDVERDLKIFRKLHGQTKQDLEERKKMMSSYKIRREDLDN